MGASKYVPSEFFIRPWPRLKVSRKPFTTCNFNLRLIKTRFYLCFDTQLPFGFEWTVVVVVATAKAPETVDELM